MTLTRWAGFHAFTELEQEMHTLLDHFGGRPWLEGFGWRPETDLRLDGSTLVIESDLPGIDPIQSLNVRLTGSVLSIEGDRSIPSDVRETDLIVQERRRGHFHRIVMLPDGIEAGLIEASYTNGALTIRVPIPETPAMPTNQQEIRVHVVG